MTEQETSPIRSGAQAASAGSPRASGILRQILAFGLETALLFAVAYAAIAAFPGHRILAAVAALVLAVVLWGFFMAPRARYRLPWPALPVVAACAFLAGAAALAASGLMIPGLLLGVAAVANVVWDLVSGRPAVDSPPRPAGRRSARH